jgi:hypothetical protein
VKVSEEKIFSLQKDSSIQVFVRQVYPGATGYALLDGE